MSKRYIDNYGFTSDNRGDFYPDDEVRELTADDFLNGCSSMEFQRDYNGTVVVANIVVQENPTVVIDLVERMVIASWGCCEVILCFEEIQDVVGLMDALVKRHAL